MTGKLINTERYSVRLSFVLYSSQLFMIGIEQDLEERLGSKVDIVSYRPTMNPFLKRWIDNEVVYA